jgi:hypothetical protein
MAQRAKKAKARQPSKPKTYTGFGHTVDDATVAAHAQIPENPKIADEIIKSKVVDWGRETGGFAPLNRIYVTVVQVQRGR